MAIVDDDSRVLESLGDLIESAGYTARCYSAAEDLLAHGIRDIDVLVTDIGMPIIDGIELLGIVRGMRKDLPVFFITGSSDITHNNRAKGSCGIFRKPFDGQALLGAISAVLPPVSERHK